MDNQKLNTERLIKSLRENEEVKKLNIYEGNRALWDHYFSIKGYLNNLFFYIVIYSNDLEEQVIITNSTDCKEEIEKILIKFNLV